MRAVKNKKRISKNTNLIEEFTKNAILESETALVVDFFHDETLSLSASKKKIRSFFEKIREKLGETEHIVLTTMDNQMPCHKGLFFGVLPDQGDRIIEAAWPNCRIRCVEKGGARQYAYEFSDFYAEAAENLSETKENSRNTKSKLFQRSRGATLQAA